MKYLMRIYQSKLLILTLAIFASQGLQAGEVTTTFSEGLNLTDTHMTEIKDAVNDNDASVTILDADVTTLDANVTILQNQLAGAAFTSVTTETAVTTDTVVASLTITAPTDGVIVVNTSGYTVYTATPGGFRCSITESTTAIDFNWLIIGTGSTTDTYMPFASTRLYTVTAGANTYNLVCDAYTGTVSIGRPKLTAIFVPNAY